jgi:hypothetical protein
MEKILKTIGTIVVIILMSFIVYKVFNLQLFFMKSFKEGLVSSSLTTTPTITDGYGINAKTMATNIKSLSTALSDKLIVSKYRTDYENIIINMEDYINLLMINNVLTFNASSFSNDDDIIKYLNNLGSLKSSRDALNDVMKYLDTMK